MVKNAKHPIDWGLVTIKEICKSLNYGTSKKSTFSGKCAVLRMGNLQNGYIDWTDLVFTNDEKDIQKYSLVKGDVLFNRTNSADLVGKTSLYRGEYPAIYAGYLINLNYDRKKVVGEYLNYILNTQEAKKYCLAVKTDGVSQSNINAQKIGAFLFHLPPFEEQKKISEFLSDVDNLIFSLQKLVEKKKAIKQGAMQELLTGKKRLPGFSGKRKRKKLGNYIKFEVGFPFKSQYFNSQHIGLRLIKNRDLKSDDQVYYTTEDVSSEYIVNNGDVLVGMDGDFTPCIWRKGVALLNQRVGRIGAFGMDLLFSYYLLQQPLQELQIGTGATTVKHLSHFDVEELELTFPEEIKEQQAIAQALSDMDNDIEQLEKKLSKYQQIKQGMMQDLLTGRIRLV